MVVVVVLGVVVVVLGLVVVVLGLVVVVLGVVVVLVVVVGAGAPEVPDSTVSIGPVQSGSVRSTSPSPSSSTVFAHWGSALVASGASGGVTCASA